MRLVMAELRPRPAPSRDQRDHHTAAFPPGEQAALGITNQMAMLQGPHAGGLPVRDSGPVVVRPLVGGLGARVRAQRAERHDSLL